MGRHDHFFWSQDWIKVVTIAGGDSKSRQRYLETSCNYRQPLDDFTAWLGLGELHSHFGNVNMFPHVLGVHACHLGKKVCVWLACQSAQCCIAAIYMKECLGNFVLFMLAHVSAKRVLF